MKRLGIPTTFGKSLLHCFKAFIKCSSKFSEAMSNVVKDFNCSRKLCNFVNLKLKLKIVLQIFVFICSKAVQVQEQDLDNLVTNFPQLIKYGDFIRSYRHQSNVLVT